MPRICTLCFYTCWTLSKKGVPIASKLMILLNLRISDRPLGNSFLQSMNLDGTFSKLMRMIEYLDRKSLLNSSLRTSKSKMLNNCKANK